MGSRPEVCIVIARAFVIALCLVLVSLRGAHGAPAAKSAKQARVPVEDERGARELAEAGLKGDRGAEAKLLKALAGSDRKARYAAIRSLGLVRSKAAVKKLETLAKSKDAGERELALEALARAGAPGAPATACRAGEAAGCRALQWSVPAEDSTAVLRLALSRPEPEARAAALLSLARRGEGSGLIEAASELLSDPRPAVRIDAAYALGVLGGPSALSALEAALGREKDALARQALAATAEKLRR